MFCGRNRFTAWVAFLGPKWREVARFTTWVVFLGPKWREVALPSKKHIRGALEQGLLAFSPGRCQRSLPFRSRHPACTSKPQVYRSTSRVAKSSRLCFCRCSLALTHGCKEGSETRSMPLCSFGPPQTFQHPAQLFTTGCTPTHRLYPVAEGAFDKTLFPGCARAEQLSASWREATSARGTSPLLLRRMRRFRKRNTTRSS